MSSSTTNHVQSQQGVSRERGSRWRDEATCCALPCEASLSRGTRNTRTKPELLLQKTNHDAWRLLVKELTETLKDTGSQTWLVFRTTVAGWSTGTVDCLQKKQPGPAHSKRKAFLCSVSLTDNRLLCVGHQLPTVAFLDLLQQGARSSATPGSPWVKQDNEWSDLQMPVSNCGGKNWII